MNHATTNHATTNPATTSKDTTRMEAKSSKLRRRFRPLLGSLRVGGLRLGGLAIAWLSLGTATASWAFDAESTVAGVVEQATLRSRLHRRLMARFAHPLGVFEPLRLDLSDVHNTEKSARAPGELGPLAASAVVENPRAGIRGRSIYGRLSGLPHSEGYAPDWQQEGGRLYPLARMHALGWLSAGAVIEHNPGVRLRHHFFNPATGQGLSRRADQSAGAAASQALQGGLSSLRELMTGTAFDGTGLAAPDWLLAEENELGYPAFLRAYERTVLAESAAERDSALAEALLCAGAMMGVLSQMADPAYVRGDLRAVVQGDGASRVAARFGRAAVPVPSSRDVALPYRLRDLFADGEGGGLAEQTARRCQPAWHCYAGTAAAQLSDAAQYARRLLDYLFRSELVLSLKDGALTVMVDEVAIGSGTLLVLAEDAEGRRHLLRSLSTPPTLTGGEAAQVALAGSELVGVTRLAVLYRGRDRANQPLVTASHLLLPLPPEKPAAP